ncbi:response regulator transcription factor [Anaerosalibacter sp. Marseille-P3206]|uniref:response regulator transcription factor n=1 Tax=Anaerosalibacter sp. Marseille-P3206 TaxID=1871005 RepID=UPI00117879B7|nr:response regulator transcription factor [Anaerosalibacter sp. Marseille-P3206]
MIQMILREENYINITTATSVEEALSVFKNSEVDLAILDIMLPDGNGYDILKEIRKSSNIPVLFLSAKDDMEDQYHGFSLGADDYLTKPFYPKDLLFRIHAILKRAYPEDSKTTNLKHAIIHWDRAEIEKDNTFIPLKANEFAILEVLNRNNNRIVTIDNICQAVWGDAYYGYENSLMAHIRKIREKIEVNPSHPNSLITIKGLGYKLIVEGGK